MADFAQFLGYAKSNEKIFEGKKKKITALYIKCTIGLKQKKNQ